MQRLILFARRPVLGRVKTRLVPPLTAETALRLYRAFLADQLRLLGELAPILPVELCLDGAGRLGGDAEPIPRAVTCTTQGPGNLGARLERTFQRTAAAGVTATVIIGSDSPTLPAERIHEAFRLLAGGSRAVVSPAEDGGFVLLGLAAPWPELFRGVPWSGPRVLEVMRDRAAAEARSLDELAAGFDVDDLIGLRRLSREFARGPAAARAPATARVMAGLETADFSVL